MNAKAVVVALRPLVGHLVSALTDDGYRTMRVAAVRHLPPGERVNDDGNMILDAGTVDAEGRPEGMMFWARDVRTVEWAEREVSLVWKERGTCRVKVQDYETEKE